MAVGIPPAELHEKAVGNLFPDPLVPTLLVQAQANREITMNRIMWQGESSSVEKVKQEGWHLLDEVLEEGSVAVSRAGRDADEIELRIEGENCGWVFVRDADGKWWDDRERHTSEGGDAHHAVATVATQLADAKEAGADELMLAAEYLRDSVDQLRAGESLFGPRSAS